MSYIILILVFLISCIIYRKYFHDSLPVDFRKNEIIEKQSLQETKQVLPLLKKLSVLDEAKLVIPSAAIAKDQLEYKSNPEREWIIEMSPVHKEYFLKSDIKRMFDLDWKQNYPSSTYGFSPTLNRWTYVFATGSPSYYSKIHIGIDVQSIPRNQAGEYDADQLEQYFTALQNKSRQHFPHLILKRLESIPVAIEKAKALLALHQQVYLDMIVILRNDQAFEEQIVKDLFLKLGLHEGDDLSFHWLNNSNYGYHHHFSVSRHSSLGYLDTLSTKSGKHSPLDIVFRFSVPKSADPFGIFMVMLECAIFCRDRLGGVLVNHQGQPLDSAKEQIELDRVISTMKKNGIEPGSDRALNMF